MAALVSCPKHTMVACLEKTKRNAQFYKIVDFLTRSSIYYSLTVSPTVSTSLIEQFWNTATSKTVNDVSYIKAKVAGKTVSISEASIRRDLLFNDVDGTDCHVTPLFPNMLAQAVVAEDEVPRDSLEGTDGSKKDQVQSSNDRHHLGGNTSERAKGGLNLQVLHNTCTLLSQQVLDLQKAKDAQAVEILKLKTRIKRLEKKCKPIISHHKAWLRSVSKLPRMKKLGKKESISKQGRKNTKPGPTLDAFNDHDADLAHGIDYMETEEAMNKGRQSNETEELNLEVDTEVITEDKGSVSTVGVTISTADPELSVVEPRTPSTTTSIFDDEDITMAQTLIKMKEEKAKEKGVAFKDVEDSLRPVRSITTLKPLPSIDPKEKGKGILVEEEPVKIKRKDQGIDQIDIDEELAHKLHEEELAEIARIQEEKAAQEEASSVAIMEMFDEVQAGIDADALFAAKLQQEEREEYIIEEREKFLAKTIDAQRKFRVAQRAAEIRSRPPTKSQLRNLMMTYLKNMGGYKHSQLKAKTFEEIQAMYERQKKRIDDFQPMDSDDAVKDSKKSAGEYISKKEEVLKEPDSTKIESMNKEDAGERESKFYHYDRHGAEGIYYRIFRSDGSSRWIKTFSEMVTRFDRLDLVELYNLNQERWNLKSWNFYENCGVHTLTLDDGTEIHMLAERKYPLTKETLERMMSLKLIAESASDDAYDLLRFIQKKIDEAGSHDGGEKDL
ncbi:hypothetical protein Tco_0935857 [Tanacetum coccineum]